MAALDQQRRVRTQRAIAEIRPGWSTAQILVRKVSDQQVATFLAALASLPEISEGAEITVVHSPVREIGSSLPKSQNMSQKALVLEEL